MDNEDDQNFIIGKHEENKNTNKLINDFPEKPVVKAHQLNGMNINKEILKAIYYHKSVLIDELRSVDKKNTGLISFNDILIAFVKANIHSEFTSNLISDIINIYYPNKSEKIDYMKLVSYFLSDLKIILENNNQSTLIPNVTNQNSFRPNTTGSTSLFNPKYLSKTANQLINSKNTSSFPPISLHNSQSTLEGK